MEQNRLTTCRNKCSYHNLDINNYWYNITIFTIFLNKLTRRSRGLVLLSTIYRISVCKRLNFAFYFKLDLQNNHASSKEYRM